MSKRRNRQAAKLQCREQRVSCAGRRAGRTGRRRRPLSSSCLHVPRNLYRRTRGRQYTRAAAPYRAAFRRYRAWRRPARVRPSATRRLLRQPSRASRAENISSIAQNLRILHVLLRGACRRINARAPAYGAAAAGWAQARNRRAISIYEKKKASSVIPAARMCRQARRAWWRRSRLREIMRQRGGMSPRARQCRHPLRGRQQLSRSPLPSLTRRSVSSHHVILCIRPASAYSAAAASKKRSPATALRGERAARSCRAEKKRLRKAVDAGARCSACCSCMRAPSVA